MYGRDRLGGVLRRALTVVRDEEITFLAAGVAYYAFVSLIPGAVVALVIATAVGGDTLAQAVVRAGGGLLTSEGEAVLMAALANDVGRGGATVVGLPLALWGALKVFRGLDRAFSQVYGMETPTSLPGQLRNATLVAGSVGASLVVMIVLGGLLVALDFGFLLETFGVLLLPLVLATAFLPMYYAFPGVEVTAREALPGAAFAAVGWTVLQAGFQVYIGVVGTAGTQLYGAIGGFLLLITWLYAAAVLLLAGAAINVALAFEPQSLSLEQERREDSPATSNRHGQDPSDRDLGGMSDDRDRDDAVNGSDDGAAPDIAALDRQVDRLQRELDEIADRTVEKPALEAELRRYVRRRMRRGHARGWGPYLVLLYGTVMVLGAFVYLDGLVAIAAMIVLFLSTLGLYTLFVIVGLGLNAAGYPGKLIDLARDYRSDE